MKSPRPSSSAKQRANRQPKKTGGGPRQSPKHRRSNRNTPPGNGELHLFGLHTVRAALENPARRKSVLHCTQNALSRLDSDLVEQAGLSVQLCDTQALAAMVGREAVHQGVVLECAALDDLDASELFHLADARLVLALDQITDPHNVGAILRSAVACGVDAVLVTHRNSATETAVLAKSASGALDLIRVISVRNLAKALEELNQMGFQSIGLDSQGTDILEQSFPDAPSPRIAIVLGSEGRGLREKTRNTCTTLARLDMPGAIKSLNVSNAAAIALYLSSSMIYRESRNTTSGKRAS